MRRLALDPLAWLPLAAGLLAALAGALLATVPPRAAAEATSGWTVPRWQPESTSAAASAMRERGLMGSAAAPTLPPELAAMSPAAPVVELTAPDWRVVAVAIRGAERVAIIQTGAQQPAELREGDKLPGGALIRRIEPDRLLLMIDGKRRALPVYKE